MKISQKPNIFVHFYIYIPLNRILYFVDCHLAFCCIFLAIFLQDWHYKYPSLSNSCLILQFEMWIWMSGEYCFIWICLVFQVWIASSMIVKEVSKSLFKYIWFLSLERYLDTRDLDNNTYILKGYCTKMLFIVVGSFDCRGQSQWLSA